MVVDDQIKVEFGEHYGLGPAEELADHTIALTLVASADHRADRYVEGIKRRELAVLVQYPFEAMLIRRRRHFKGVLAFATKGRPVRSTPATPVPVWFSTRHVDDFAPLRILACDANNGFSKFSFYDPPLRHRDIVVRTIDYRTYQVGHVL